MSLELYGLLFFVLFYLLYVVLPMIFMERDHNRARPMDGIAGFCVQSDIGL